jgi:hypothetical protein
MMKKIAITLCSLALLSCSSNSKKDNYDEAEVNDSSPTSEESISMIDEDVEGTDWDDSDDEYEETVPITRMYRIEKGDTYMWIAYKLFGDYRKWRELASANPKMSSGKLKVGSSIEYIAPEVDYRWEEEGVAYRILPGDNLTKISSKLFGETTLWTNLWENNKRMIDQPDLIYSGFTLFYKDLKTISEDEVASRD